MASERNTNIPTLRRLPGGVHRSCRACRDEGRFYSHPRRLYVRAERGRGYVAVGYVCPYSHVELDDAPVDRAE